MRGPGCSVGGGRVALCEVALKKRNDDANRAAEWLMVGGTEVASKTLEAFMAAHPSHLLFKLDAKNAYFSPSHNARTTEDREVMRAIWSWQPETAEPVAETSS